MTQPRRATPAHPQATARRPVGQPTRGKTAKNRLRRVDNFLARYDPALIRRRDGDFANALFVDLGYGAEPWTTLESAARLRQLQPQLPVLGVEIDPERVVAAQPFADTLTEFRLGGFNLPLRPRGDGQPETVRAIRVFNVLRQYEEHEVAAAWQQMLSALLPGGLLIEGTSDPYGRIWVANVMRRIAGCELRVASNDNAADAIRHSQLASEALVFSTNFRTGFDPGEFQERLPKNLIHRVIEGEPIYEFFAAWKRAAATAIPHKVFGLRQWFIASALILAEQGYPIDRRRTWLRDGYLIVRGSWNNNG